MPLKKKKMFDLDHGIETKDNDEVEVKDRASISDPIVRNKSGRALNDDNMGHTLEKIFQKIKKIEHRVALSK